MTDDVYEEPGSNNIALNRLKSMFESNSAPMATKPPLKVPAKPSYLRTANQNGNVPTLPVKSADKKEDSTDVNSNSVIPTKPGKRSSQVNIPAAFLKSASDEKPKPPPASKKPTVKSKEDSSNDKPDSVPKTPTKPNEKPSWQKPEGTPKPDPPWKPKVTKSDEPSGNSSNESKPIPLWKQELLKRKQQEENKSESSPQTSNECGNTKISSWKQKEQENDTSTPVNKPVKPWKVGIPPDTLGVKPVTPPQSAKPTIPSPAAKPATPSPAAKPKPHVPGPTFPKQNLQSPMGINKNELEKIFGRKQNESNNESVTLRKTANGSAPKPKAVRKSFTRTLDDKKFFQVLVEEIDVDFPPPPKPDKLVNFAELERIIAEYKAQLDELEGKKTSPSPRNMGNEEPEEVIEEDIYEPIPADEEEEEPVPLRKSFNKTSSKRLTREPSMIKPMESDEEDEEMYDDTAVPPSTDSLPPPISSLPPPRSPVPERSQPTSPPPPPPPKASVSEPVDQEEYTDCTVLENENEEELTQDDVYEPLDEIQNEVEKIDEKKKKDDKEEQKRKETERKKKEAEEKKEALRKEKQRKEEEKRKKKEKEKQEKELKALLKTFKTPVDLNASNGEGIIKNDCKGAKFELEVKAGDRVVIVRINECPQGKWLCKLTETGRVGFVECVNVEVDNTLIKAHDEEVMAGGLINSADLPPPPDDFLCEEYDDVHAVSNDQEEYDDVHNTVEPQQDELYEAM